MDAAGCAHELIAFYGTLMSDHATQRELGVEHELRLLARCELAGSLYDLGEWPTFVPGEGVVHGELFAIVDARVLAKLDAFEGYDPADETRSSYLRVLLALRRPSVRAWVYVANEPLGEAPRIGSGSWRATSGADDSP